TAPICLLAWVFRQWVSTLNHETLHNAMKAGAVVKSLIGERLEIFDGLGRDVRPEFDDHRSVAGLDDGHFVDIDGGGRGGCVGFGFVSQSRHHSSGKDNGTSV